MTTDPTQLAIGGAWTISGLGLGLCLWGWLREKHPIRRMRLMDCGVVLLFAATLTRVIVQRAAFTPLDWGLAILSPIFILAALWRLGRTQGAGKEP